MKYGSHFARYVQKDFLISATGVLLACIVAIAAHATPVVKESVDFVLSPRGHALVPVSINSSKPLIFVLDTAAGKTFITPSAVEMLGLAEVPGEGDSTLGVHGKDVNPVVKIQSLAVGNVRVEDVQAIVLGLDHITRGNWQADGVLGMDFLSRFDVRLDYF